MELLKSLDGDGCVGMESSMAGLDEKCKGCPQRQVCIDSRGKRMENPDLKKIKENMKNVKHKYLVLSGKGGVGKSTVASQLAYILSETEEDDDDDDEKEVPQVGILDLDLCGPSIPALFQIEGRRVRGSSLGWQPVYVTDNLGIVSIEFMMKDLDRANIWRGPKKNGVIIQFLRDVFWGEDGLDFLIIDTPPGTSDEHITVGQSLVPCDLDGAIIVTTPQDLSVIDVKKEIGFCNKIGIPIIGVIENMSGFVCPKCKTNTDIFSRGGGEDLAKEFGTEFLGRIPLDPQLMNACEKGVSFVESFPNSETSTILRGISKRILDLTEKKEDKSKKEKKKK